MKKTILVTVCLMMLLSLAVLAAGLKKDEKPNPTQTTQERVKTSQETTATQETKSIVEAIRELPECSQFLSWAEKTGTIKELEGKGPMTVLVPIDTAFDSMSPDLRKEIQENKAKNKSCCRFHIVKGNLSLMELKATEELETLCDVDDCTMNFSAALTESKDLIRKEILCKNGRIYLINTVLVPECCEKSFLEKATDEAKHLYEETRDFIGNEVEKASDAVKNAFPHESEPQ